MLERGLLVITLVAGAAVGVFWPTQKPKPAAPSNSAVEVTLQRSSDSHFYATANVNGRDIRFLVDTGASEIALTEDDARKVGIKFDPSRYELLGEGASGYVRGQYVKLDTIQLDGFHQNSAKAVVVEGANISLLGQPFLENVDEIVIRKGEMVLRDQG
jgi:aspartyl protease family protein